MYNSKLRREEGIGEEASYIQEYTSTLHSVLVLDHVILRALAMYVES